MPVFYNKNVPLEAALQQMLDYLQRTGQKHCDKIKATMDVVWRRAAALTHHFCEVNFHRSIECYAYSDYIIFGSIYMFTPYIAPGISNNRSEVFSYR